MLDIAERYNIGEEAKKVIEQGVSVRGISDISYADIAPAKEHLDRGEDLRHYNDYKGLFFVVVDQKHCLSAINVALKRISLNEPISLLWADDPKCAEYLTSTFEMLWQQSVPAEERIKELQKQGPPQA